MNPIKKKLARELTEAIKVAMDKTDPDTSCARAIEGLDRNALLIRDVNRLCDELSTLEAGKILSLGNEVLGAGNANAYRKKREEIRSLMFKAMKRVEKKYGGLSLPKECEDSLISLL